MRSVVIDLSLGTLLFVIAMGSTAGLWTACSHSYAGHSEKEVLQAMAEACPEGCYRFVPDDPTCYRIEECWVGSGAECSYMEKCGEEIVKAADGQCYDKAHGWQVECGE